MSSDSSLSKSIKNVASSFQNTYKEFKSKANQRSHYSQYLHTYVHVCMYLNPSLLTDKHELVKSFTCRAFGLVLIRVSSPDIRGLLPGPVNPTNPFLNGGGGGGDGYNYGMTGKGEDEYIRRSFQV